MKALLYKQLRLVCHPMTPVFCLFGIMVIIPNYPYTVIFSTSRWGCSSAS